MLFDGVSRGQVAIGDVAGRDGGSAGVPGAGARSSTTWRTRPADWQRRYPQTMATSLLPSDPISIADPHSYSSHFRRTENCWDVVLGVALIDDGQSIRYACGYCHRSSLGNTARRLSHCRETESYQRRPGSGRPRVKEPQDDRFLTLRILQNRNFTIVQAIHQLQEVPGLQISERTARRRLNQYGLLLFTSHWSLDDWSAAHFTDECRFALRSPDGREIVWRRRNERYEAWNFSQRLPFKRSTIVMVWTGIKMENRVGCWRVFDGHSLFG
ncbi:uncharacterized protein LOC112127627 [Cimex lectularius]|uniref:Transposase Tc1-like domain-containing protein n=1 Tax=Cimex lectularius TaxID=79782 RepID=A0A8I6SLJ8_CIMLE|nr:uncharacterized protein LOC112127627 [Cimex lectularius]